MPFTASAPAISFILVVLLHGIDAVRLAHGIQFINEDNDWGFVLGLLEEIPTCDVYGLTSNVTVVDALGAISLGTLL